MPSCSSRRATSTSGSARSRAARQFAHAVEAGELGQVLAAVDAGRVRRLEGGEEIAEGVHAILLGGHSPGQIALGIDALGGRIVLASDAVHFYEELERDRPFGVMADLAEMYEGYDTLRELAGAAARIWCPATTPRS